MKKYFTFVFTMIFTLMLTVIMGTTVAFAASAQPAKAHVLVDGKYVPFAAYQVDGNFYFSESDVKNALHMTQETVVMEEKGCTINGQEYYKLRDLGQVLGFQVEWNNKTRIISLTTDVPATGAAPQDDKAAKFMDEVIRLTNVERAKEGLKPLTEMGSLNTAAQIRVHEIDDVFSHTRPNGTRCFTVMAEAGIDRYRIVGENLASGFSSPEKVVKAWMESPGHRANIMKPEFERIGVAYKDNDWVQLFFTA